MKYTITSSDPFFPYVEFDNLTDAELWLDEYIYRLFQDWKKSWYGEMYVEVTRGKEFWYYTIKEL